MKIAYLENMIHLEIYTQSVNKVCLICKQSEVSSFVFNNAESSCTVCDLRCPVGMRLDLVHFIAAFSLQNASFGISEYHHRIKVFFFSLIDYMLDANIMPTITQWYASRCYVYDQEALTGDEMESLLDTVEDAIKNYGCRVIVLDNLMTAMMDDESIDLYRQQTRFVNGLTLLAKTFNVCVILVAHPKKNSTGDADIISGSGNIANLADVVLEYARSKSDTNFDCLVKILKNRTTGFENHEGIPLWFEQSSKRISGRPKIFSLGLPWEKSDYVPEPVFEELEDTEYDIPF